ncbi:unnamed protein product [Amoebophrya sp. A25]|nr:unnamed protein product [Amoebophrya sp. A25]|eukprot:GSA25T00014113001.1
MMWQWKLREEARRGEDTTVSGMHGRVTTEEVAATSSCVEQEKQSAASSSSTSCSSGASASGKDDSQPKQSLLASSADLRRAEVAASEGNKPDQQREQENSSSSSSPATRPQLPNLLTFADMDTWSVGLVLYLAIIARHFQGMRNLAYFWVWHPKMYDREEARRAAVAEAMAERVGERIEEAFSDIPGSQELAQGPNIRGAQELAQATGAASSTTAADYGPARTIPASTTDARAAEPSTSTQVVVPAPTSNKVPAPSTYTHVPVPGSTATSTKPQIPRTPTRPRASPASKDHELWANSGLRWCVTKSTPPPLPVLEGEPDYLLRGSFYYNGIFRFALQCHPRHRSLRNLRAFLRAVHAESKLYGSQ